MGFTSLELEESVVARNALVSLVRSLSSPNERSEAETVLVILVILYALDSPSKHYFLSLKRSWQQITFGHDRLR